jgi:hypothetical protein
LSADSAIKISEEDDLGFLLYVVWKRHCMIIAKVCVDFSSLVDEEEIWYGEEAVWHDLVATKMRGSPVSLCHVPGVVK